MPIPGAETARHRPCRFFPGFLLIAAAVISGCAGIRPAEPVREDLLPERALSLSAAICPTGIVTATARIEVIRRDERFPLKAALMIKPPASLRLESIPLLGPPDFFLSAASGVLHVFIPAQGGFYAGQATAANIARFLPLPLPPDEIVPLLLGQAPETKPASSLQGELRQGLYRVDERAGGRTIRSLWFDPDENRLLKIQTVAAGGEPLYTAEFADPLRIGNGVIPQRLNVGGEGWSLAVRYTELRQLDGAEADPFTLPIPDGIPVVSLD
jgi:hypothetical protein